MEWALLISVSLLRGVALTALVWKLFLSGVVREYRIFTGFLVWLVVASGSMWAAFEVVGGGRLYGKLWLTKEFLTSAVALCALLEIFNILLAEFRGFQRLGQQLIRGCLIISALLTALLWVPFDGLESWRAFTTFEGRTVYVSLAITVACFALCAAHFRLRASRNTLIVLAVLVGMLMARGADYTLRSYLPREWGNVILVSTSCWEVLWVVMAVALLSAQGRVVARPSVAVAAPGAEQAAAKRLEAMNDALIRVLRL